MDFDTYKTAGQIHYQRCHWMTACVSLIVFAGVLNVTVAQQAVGRRRRARMPHFTLLPSRDWR
jgi:hypothetical protein